MVLHCEQEAVEDLQIAVNVVYEEALYVPEENLKVFAIFPYYDSTFCGVT